MIQSKNVGTNRNLGLLSFLSFRLLSHLSRERNNRNGMRAERLLSFFSHTPTRGGVIDVGGWKERKERKEIYNTNIINYLHSSFFPYFFPASWKEIGAFAQQAR